MSINTTSGYGTSVKTTTGKSSTTDLSSLTVSGNADIGGNTTVGGNLTVSGTLSSSSYNPANLTVTGATNVNTLTATGSTNLTDLTATGTSTLSSLTVPAMTGPTVLTGDLTVTGTLTSSSGATNFDKLYLKDALSSTTQSTATLATYNASNTVNLLQVQTSTTGAGATTGSIFGVNATDTVILNHQESADILLRWDSGNATYNGAVRIRGGKFFIRADGTSDGTFSSTATMGTYRSVATNTLHFQNSNSGTGASVGSTVGVVNDDLNIRNYTVGGTITLQLPNGSIVFDNNGDVTIPNNVTIGGTLTQTPSLIGTVQSVAFGINSSGSLTAGANIGPWLGTDKLLPSFQSITLVAFTANVISATTTNLVLGVYRSFNTASVATMNVGSLTNTAQRATTANGTMNTTLTNASNTLQSIGVQVNSGSYSGGTGGGLTVIIYFYVNTI